MPESSTLRDLGYLNDIVESARTALFHIGNRNMKEFLGDVTAQDAVIRRITVIGEAAARISEDFRAAHPNLPWRRIVGMRNVLVHDYAEVDLDVVWEVATEKLPELIEVLEKFLDTVSE